MTPSSAIKLIFISPVHPRLSKFFLALGVSIFMAMITPTLGLLLNGQYEIAEEFMKCISVYFGGFITLLYTLVFSITEFVSYVDQYGQAVARDGYFWQFIILRIICVVDHHIYLLIQYLSWKRSNKYPSLTYNRYSWRFFGFSFALFLHVGHNNIWGGWVVNQLFSF
jgi:hypothetical protein